ncbi:beta-galactosidase [Kitasatospora sp. NBC_00240]|uniref:beta-galactosidase n=1 Tax=Kitasatospora sp. NBC_00240 TaxID=2903567 RepID=UPI00225771F5|nr:beta-galactosidase [Kitasatospora sp. NBC_00240]MCX5216049.1 beta-galactosidase [Kitasatospora sp. NBC_00240]
MRRSGHRAIPALLVSAAMALGGLAGTMPAQAAPAAAPAVTPTSHTVTWDDHSLRIDDKPTYIWGGEFHYFRLPSPDLWRDVLQKMKSGGFNAVSLYFDWAYHSPKKGVYDFTGVRDVDKLLDIANEVGIYVIARPGPYIQAEVDGGGYPAWLNTTPGHEKSTDPDHLANADEWLDRINPIIARHQLTTGQGTVIAYQLENEFQHTAPADVEYVTHLRQKAVGAGINVPFTGNHWDAYNFPDSPVDIDGYDDYPLLFTCADPTWKPVTDYSSKKPAGKPLYLPEFQGGSINYWGGTDGDKCREKMGADFASVFYKNNIASGATMQSFYMTYGGTNWGRQAVTGTYTSYDYGAAITEPRQLTDRYQQDKLIGYFLQSVTPITKTDKVAAPALTNSAKVTDTARRNPDTGTQFHTLRHKDSTSTGSDSTGLALTVGPNHAGYTYDDTGTQLQYTGSWTHADQNASYTAGEYQRTEAWSNTTGDSVTVPFTGTSVRWIGSKAANHGLADVYLDGNKVATVDGYGAGAEVKDQTLFNKDDLPAGNHTLKIVVTGQKNPAAPSYAKYVSVDAIDVLDTTRTRTYPTVPQKADTAVTLAGRDSKILVADYRLGASQLQYSTSEILTHAQIGDRDVAVLYGRNGQAGETVLNYSQKPDVQVLSGTVDQTWDPATGDLRLNYTHNGLARVLISGPGATRPLLLLLGDDQSAKKFWRADTADGPVLVHGSDLLRTAVASSGGLDLTGDSSVQQAVEVFAKGTGPITWNGTALATQPVAGGSAAGNLAGPTPVVLPALSGWKHTAESPEAQSGFDDSSWKVADKTASNSITKPGTLPVLFADDYGYHYGEVWYRGHFKAGNEATGINLSAATGGSGIYSVWMNGTFLGTTGDGNAHAFPFPAGVFKPGTDNEVSVLVSNMGHSQNPGMNDSNKAARGLTGAFLTGAPLSAVTWRIQGARGGEDLVDTARGPMNTGGLYGERAGWTLPDFPDSSWTTTGLATRDNTPGVSWYRTKTTLDLPAGQDTSIGLKIADDPSRKYRALIYVNGWLLGTYINNVGPQHVFPLPGGILNPRGDNTIAIALWNEGGTSGGLGTVTLENLGTTASPLNPAPVTGPGYSAATYTTPAAHNATLTLNAPDNAAPAGTYPVSATFAVPAGQQNASNVSLALDLPTGWTAQPTGTTTAAGVTAGSSVTGTWNVTAPSGALPAISSLTTTASYTQQNTAQQLTDTRTVRHLTAPTTTTDVSTMQFLGSTNSWNGGVKLDKSNDSKALTLAGTPYALGIGTNANSSVTLYLGGHCTRFSATVGVDDEVGNSGSVTFSVRADGTNLTTTPILRGSDTAAGTVDVPIPAGTTILELVAGDGGDGNSNDHADWANPKVFCS